MEKISVASRICIIVWGSHKTRLEISGRSWRKIIPCLPFFCLPPEVFLRLLVGRADLSQGARFKTPVFLPLPLDKGSHWLSCPSVQRATVLFSSQPSTEECGIWRNSLPPPYRGNLGLDRQFSKLSGGKVVVSRRMFESLQLWPNATQGQEHPAQSQLPRAPGGSMPTHSRSPVSPILLVGKPPRFSSCRAKITPPTLWDSLALWALNPLCWASYEPLEENCHVAHKPPHEMRRASKESGLEGHCRCHDGISITHGAHEHRGPHRTQAHPDLRGCSGVCPVCPHLPSTWDMPGLKVILLPGEPGACPPEPHRRTP